MAASSDSGISKDHLIADLASGEKPRGAWRIGTEHEKFAFSRQNCRRTPYEGEHGLSVLLQRMPPPDNTPIMEDGKIIGLKLNNGGSITLEPGGQIELSGAPLLSIHETCAEINQHLEQLRPICQDMHLTLIGIGHDPISRRDEVSWMPKERYQIMRDYMPTRGSMGLDMMTRTCTVQVNLDYSSENDMRKKIRISAVFQPLATALFANSPLKEMQPSGYLSTRARCWQNTDSDRTGMPNFLFEDNFSYEHWVDYALQVPMYFLYENGTYHNVAGADFRNLMAGKLPGFPDRYATMKDWNDHLTVAFPEVRLKRFIEMRGADAGRWDDLYALPALWVGLLYDAEAQAEALELAKQCSAQEIQQLSLSVPELGLGATLKDRTLHDWALEILRIAEDGLKRRRVCDTSGRDESQYLHPLRQILETGQSSAEKLLSDYENACKHGLFPPDGSTKPCSWLIDRLRN
ncbi:MAG: glutamate--cysteine ligase [Alphaproteobacteria bacterium]|nr:glutamate--cysteine ligase [Alphaproteobacteria bacterium]